MCWHDRWHLITFGPLAITTRLELTQGVAFLEPQIPTAP